MRFSRLFTPLLLVGILVALATQAARFLVVDEPAKSDAIVVLAGETNVRPARALELLRLGFAPRLFLDAQTRDLIYDQRLTDIAQRYVNALPEANQISVCPVVGFSTNAEADDVNRCLQPLGARRVLIVTSDYHTRRALMIFHHRLPQYQFHVTAARNPLQFGEAWWTHREWAKVTFDEWSKMLWWEAVDRWR
ncbi:MAG: YdcF family protein [Acidobacteriia bacterium]|nr:YdcF family protein [Terriglobia bacterium]